MVHYVWVINWFNKFTTISITFIKIPKHYSILCIPYSLSFLQNKYFHVKVVSISAENTEVTHCRVS